MRLFRQFFILPVVFLLIILFPVGCVSTSSTSGTFSTATLAKDVAAVQAVLTNIQKVPALAKVLKANAETASKFNAIVTNVGNIATSISANTNGTVSYDVGKNWADSLVSELTSVINIAQPIVEQFDPTAASYLSVASNLIPMIQALIASFGVEPTAGITYPMLYSATPHTPDQIRSILLAGIVRH